MEPTGVRRIENAITAMAITLVLLALILGGSALLVGHWCQTQSVGTGVCALLAFGLALLRSRAHRAA